MFKEAEPGSKEVNVERTGDALATGAGIVATGCPFCNTMLRDAFAALSAVQQAQERWRANQPSYATTLMTANPADCDTLAEQVANSCLNIAAPGSGRYVYALSAVSATAAP